MAWSFDGVTIDISGPSALTRVKEVQYTARTIPDTSPPVTFIDVSGVLPEQVTLPLRFATDGDYTTFLAKVNVTGHLIYPDYPTAPGRDGLLLRVTRTRVLTSTNRMTWADAEFLLI